MRVMSICLLVALGALLLTAQPALAQDGGKGAPKPAAGAGLFDNLPPAPYTPMTPRPKPVYCSQAEKDADVKRLETALAKAIDQLKIAEAYGDALSERIKAVEATRQLTKSEMGSVSYAYLDEIGDAREAVADITRWLTRPRPSP